MADNQLPIPPHHHDHGHGPHGHDHALPVVEEPLDPANQSLADALRASFRVLKLVMVVVVVMFLFSGVFTVENNEVVVLSRFGRQLVPPREPGLHFAFPYPVDVKTRVPTGPRTMLINAFWIRRSEAETGKDLNELSRSGGLDPGTDGALLTGDHAIMHLETKLTYRITNANDFVKNVSDEDALLRAVLQESSVAQAARTKADVLWKTPALVVGTPDEKGPLTIWGRAQSKLDELGTGITIDILATNESHYPLQVKEEFLEVSKAENEMRRVIQDAKQKWEEKLKGAAGPAWEALNNKIKELDQVHSDEQRKPIFEAIDAILIKDATGEAGKKIQLAKGTRDKVVADAQSAADRFLILLNAYQKNPELVRQRQRQDMLAKVFSQSGLSRWFLPAGNNIIWLNKNPEEIRAAEIKAIKDKAMGKK